jgi:two-component system sensor histidine kinase HydH
MLICIEFGRENNSKVRKEGFMVGSGDRVKIISIFILVGAITFFQYFTELREHAHHIFYQGLFFLPVMLAGFWFGLRSALATSLSVTFILVPFTFMHWKGFSAGDVNNVMEMALYNVVALILGKLKDRERAEQKRLQEAESLAILGKAVSALAHDLKTPLMAIGGFSRSAQKHLPEDDHYREKLNLVIEETQRLENMVQEMLDFSHPLELNRSPKDIKQVVTQSIAIIAYAAQKKKVEVQSQFSQNPLLVSIDDLRLEQALINLLINAVEASPEGETVRVDSYENRGDLFIDVSDCGRGIPPDKREKIFLPFFTTKRGGTGLGLAIVKKIVEAHQGQLEVLDNPGTGLTF